MFRFACALVMVAAVAWPAAADIPPPPPAAGFKRVPYEHVLKLDADLPGYKFFPFTRLGIGGKETLGDELKLAADKGVVVPGSASPSVRTGVVAVPAAVWGELKTTENVAKLLSRENKQTLPAGVVVYETYGTSHDLSERDPRAKVENVITVTRDEKAGVKFTAKEAPAGADPAPTARPPLALLVAGVAAALGVVMLGLWYARRK